MLKTSDLEQLLLTPVLRSSHLAFCNDVPSVMGFSMAIMGLVIKKKTNWYHIKLENNDLVCSFVVIDY